MVQAPAVLLAAVLASACADTGSEKLIAEGHFKRARPLVEAQLASNPDDAQANYLLSRIKLAMDDRQGALSPAERAVAVRPRESSYHLQLAEAVGGIAEHAAIFSQIALTRRFKKEIDVALALDPKNADALFDLMEFYLQAPAFFGGDKKKAHAVADKIVVIDPVQGAVALVRLAKVDDRPERIEGILSTAVEARPQSYAAQTALARFYLKHGVLDRADVHARAAYALDRGRTDAYILRAAILARGRQWSEMEATLSDCEKQVPDDLSPYYRIGTVLTARTQELARAERYLRKYLSQEPEGKRPGLRFAWWRLGQNLEKQGRTPDAIAAFEESVKLDSHSPAAKNLKRLK